MATLETADVLEPTQADIEAARESVRVLADTLDSVTRHAVNGLVQFQTLPVPEAALPLLMRVLGEMAAGHTVAVHPILEEPLSTTEAAAMLNISRPTLINLLEAGEIHYHRVGTHRRVSHASLFDYKRRMESGEIAASRPTREERLRGLREMVRIGMEAGEPY